MKPFTIQKPDLWSFIIMVFIIVVAAVITARYSTTNYHDLEYKKMILEASNENVTIDEVGSIVAKTFLMSQN